MHGHIFQPLTGRGIARTFLGEEPPNRKTKMKKAIKKDERVCPKIGDKSRVSRCVSTPSPGKCFGFLSLQECTRWYQDIQSLYDDALLLLVCYHKLYDLLC